MSEEKPLSLSIVVEGDDNIVHLTKLHLSPVVAIGNFDGMHLGHQAIFKQVQKRVEENSFFGLALTFKPHPKLFFDPDAPHFLLQSYEEKCELGQRFSIDKVLCLNFEKVVRWEPRTFVEKVLVNSLKTKFVVVGEGFTFGKGRSGTTQTLIDLCAEHGIHVDVVKPLFVQDVGISDPHIADLPVSSTLVRKFLGLGDFERVRQLLGHDWYMKGEVIRGDGEGKKLGYPTANINIHPHDRLLPPPGIYATRLRVVSSDLLGYWDSVTYVGTRPTVFGDEMRVETYAINPPESFDLYGKNVNVYFLRRVRDDAHFNSLDQMVVQMGKDVEDAKKIFKELKELADDSE